MDVEGNIAILEKFTWMDHWASEKDIRIPPVEDGKLDQTWSLNNIVIKLLLASQLAHKWWWCCLYQGRSTPP